jgi:predicted amidohydrolase
MSTTVIPEQARTSQRRRGPAASTAGARKAGVPANGVRVGLVQSHSSVGTETFDPRDENLERAIDAIRAAANEGARLVVFGEMYLSGYRTDEWLHKWASHADASDRHVSALIKEAHERNVHIIMGAGTFGGRIPGDIYDSALLVGPRGLIGTYRKIHVAAFPHDKGLSMERCFYSPGRELPTFDTEIGKLGIHICFDMHFPEVPRVQALKGADILINVSAGADGFQEYWDHFSYIRAVENASWYLVCSVVGEQRGDRIFGGSRILDPTGTLVAAATHNEEDILIGDVDLLVSRNVRTQAHTFALRQPAAYSAIAAPRAYP